MTLQECIAIHEAATALGRPSVTYRAGGILPVERWETHALAMEKNRRHGLASECFDLAILADVYGVPVGRVAAVRPTRGGQR